MVLREEIPSDIKGIPMTSLLGKPLRTCSFFSFIFDLKINTCIQKVPKMMTFSAMALSIHVWMICAKGEKSNNETVPVSSLSLYNLDQK